MTLEVLNNLKGGGQTGVEQKSETKLLCRREAAAGSTAEYRIPQGGLEEVVRDASLKVLVYMKERETTDWQKGD